MRRKSTANVMVVGSMLVGMLLLALVQAEPVRAQFGGGQGFNFGGFNGFGQFNGGFQGAFGQFNGGFQGGFNGQFQGGGFNGQFQGGNFQGGQFNGGFQGGFNGGQFGNFQSGFNGGGFQGINIGASGPNTTCGGFNFGQGSFQFGANGINLGQIGGCTAGVFGLIPDSTQVSPGQPITYQLVWITPTNWQDLEFLELRIRNAAGNIIGILRWVQGTDEYQLIDPATGQVLARGAAGGNGTLEGPYLTVVLSRSSSENTGATGQAVGLSITLILKELAANNLYGIDVRAKLDNAAVVPYELAALIFVTANDTVGKSDDDGDDDRKGRKPTKEELQQAQRTNRSNLDDVRTEGNALESDCGAPVPTVTIANRDGRVVIRLLHEAALACRTVQPGDYIEAVGEKQHEQLYDADELTVRRNGTRVR